ncbi:MULTISPECIES: nicotinamide riboside transporter PnuC [Flavobacterium]|uniref:Nicotinamide riboside transporter PnuC n=1 Tax=Flavobacterium jumunjinense TaxID=998845 RepID=A0ABV5GLY9_9FLAO|nr:MULTISPECIES: nicotinamide riboside transporter PnuC [Flavobacterium]
MIDFLFSQYNGYSTLFLWLEIIAATFGLISVLFATKNNILVYPTGIISTILYVYLLFQWELIGDMLINGYYTTMSFYGWYLWSKKKGDNNDIVLPITKMNNKEITQGVVIFLITTLFVVAIYHFFNKFTSWVAYVDTFTTGIFFVGMWLMAKRKIENWILWIIGDIISIPLYFHKGYTFTSFQYLIFTIIAFYAYKEWKRNLTNKI